MEDFGEDAIKDVSVGEFTPSLPKQKINFSERVDVAGGKKVTLLTTQGPNKEYPYVGYTDGVVGKFYQWNEYGECFEDEGVFLLNPPPAPNFYVYVYTDGVETSEELINPPLGGEIACLYVKPEIKKVETIRGVSKFNTLPSPEKKKSGNLVEAFTSQHRVSKSRGDVGNTYSYESSGSSADNILSSLSGLG